MGIWRELPFALIEPRLNERKRRLVSCQWQHPQVGTRRLLHAIENEASVHRPVRGNFHVVRLQQHLVAAGDRLTVQVKDAAPIRSEYVLTPVRCPDRAPFRRRVVCYSR